MCRRGRSRNRVTPVATGSIRGRSFDLPFSLLHGPDVGAPAPPCHGAPTGKAGGPCLLSRVTSPSHLPASLHHPFKFARGRARRSYPTSHPSGIVKASRAPVWRSHDHSCTIPPASSEARRSVSVKPVTGASRPFTIPSNHAAHARRRHFRLPIRPGASSASRARYGVPRATPAGW